MLYACTCEIDCQKEAIEMLQDSSGAFLGSHLEVSIIDAADLPLGILAGAKPLLLPEPPEASDSGGAVAPPPEAPNFGIP